jgi:predicted DNA-binding transcriptional regulator YafY
VRFTYHARFSSQPRPAPGAAISEREADPYTLTQAGGRWYLVAWCHERVAVRRFRLDRIEDLNVLDETFVRPANIPDRPDMDEPPRPVTIRALFSPAVARWVQEAPSPFQAGVEQLTDGLLVTLRVREADDALHWLLSWGGNVRVLEPDAVRRRLAEEAANLLANHSELLT